MGKEEDKRRRQAAAKKEDEKRKREKKHHTTPATSSSSSTRGGGRGRAAAIIPTDDDGFQEVHSRNSSPANRASSRGPRGRGGGGGRAYVPTGNEPHYMMGGIYVQINGPVPNPQRLGRILQAFWDYLQGAGQADFNQHRYYPVHAVIAAQGAHGTPLYTESAGFARDPDLTDHLTVHLLSDADARLTTPMGYTIHITTNTSGEYDPNTRASWPDYQQQLSRVGHERSNAVFLNNSRLGRRDSAPAYPAYSAPVTSAPQPQYTTATAPATNAWSVPVTQSSTYNTPALTYTYGTGSAGVDSVTSAMQQTSVRDRSRSRSRSRSPHKRSPSVERGEYIDDNGKKYYVDEKGSYYRINRKGKKVEYTPYYAPASEVPAGPYIDDAGQEYYVYANGHSVYIDSEGNQVNYDPVFTRSSGKQARR